MQCDWPNISQWAQQIQRVRMQLKSLRLHYYFTAAFRAIADRSTIIEQNDIKIPARKTQNRNVGATQGGARRGKAGQGLSNLLWQEHMYPSGGSCSKLF